ncbi:MAG TPA: RNA 3'-terminal phosphate cyclase, partial [Pyrinomonadaceae bacterium]|nr:RNA 3'-terminal phosphate cyclase [Pyrinomonadaceae bacterium]
ELVRYGFYPPGGGQLNVFIEPAQLARLDLRARGAFISQRARALVVKLPPQIAERELSIVREQLGWTEEQLQIETSNNALSPGNVLTLAFESAQVKEIITGMGERGVRAETVAERACAEARGYLAHDAPVGEHLADQLLIPLALAGGGSYTTGPLSLHTTTNIEVIKKFLPVEISTQGLGDGAWLIEVRRREL